MNTLTGPEQTALALIRVGRSFEDAMQSTGVSFDRLQELWNLDQAKKDGTR